ncbi:MAG: hypothetical protein NDI94_07150 [Candidatus Woesearchaeota archaeon]|nr:hypothetical protein [Candidatus Woesearchaeota archaeon]
MAVDEVISKLLKDGSASVRIDDKEYSLKFDGPLESYRKRDVTLEIFSGVELVGHMQFAPYTIFPIDLQHPDYGIDFVKAKDKEHLKNLGPVQVAEGYQDLAAKMIYLGMEISRAVLPNNLDLHLAKLSNMPESVGISELFDTQITANNELYFTPRNNVSFDISLSQDCQYKGAHVDKKLETAWLRLSIPMYV